MAILITLFSIILYSYIDYSVDRELKISLLKQADYLKANYENLGEAIEKQQNILKRTLQIDVNMAFVPSAQFQPAYFKIDHRGLRTYLKAYIPYDFKAQKYMVLSRDITQQTRLKNRIFRSIVIMTGIAMVIIILYAFILSRMLISPIRYFTEKMSRTNENILENIDLEKIPDEFRPLALSFNQLLGRIRSFLHYKKELFVGTAHELKTPLAVMKAKCQVSLMKRDKSVDSLENALRQNIESIDDMNRIIGSILEFGRAEGAQFESPREIDLVEFLEKTMDGFSVLAATKGRKLSTNLNPRTLMVTIRPLLLTQIIQNLLQNAIRFTPEKGKIKVTSYIKEGAFHIIVRDEGPGIDENIDIFAPFKRSRESEGTGLGLFLVKSASDALGARIRISNRGDGKGAIAVVSIPLDANPGKEDDESAIPRGVK